MRNVIRARIVNEWKAENNVSSLQWPAQSPDLNPIENLWSQLGRMIHRDPPTDLADLERKIHENWAIIGCPTCLDLIRSMPRRIQECIDARGGHTHY